MEILGPGDAGEILTLQRAAYVGEAMLYDQFLPPLHETLDEVRAALASDEVTVLGIRDAGRLIGTARIKADGDCLHVNHGKTAAGFEEVFVGKPAWIRVGCTYAHG